jgi:two-component system cell cycle sensor histidine kinase/response regulator CckA
MALQRNSRPSESDAPAIAVLIVDDDEEDARLTQDLLSEIDGTRYAPAWASSYTTALAQAREHVYDVCLVDYRLGVEDGIALVRELLGQGFDTPIVVLTGLGDRSVDVEATSAGASDYLVKGEVTPALLERTIRYAMRHHADMLTLRESEDGLRQAQRMEAVGRFAGGVAHDFNNMMSAVVGFSALVLAELEERDPLRAWVAEIERAGQRATEMTRQLLAFTRKQVLLPRVLDLNGVLQGVSDLLVHLIGEDVELVLEPAASLYPVEADSGQLEQVIVNLAVNARDAMPDGGRLTIATANVELDESAAAARPDLVPGSFVAISVSDTGEGMERETLERIFEPFFTTKDEGKGTGLGLATVFGIVKQSGGDIQAESALGRGSTFTIYLPRVAAPVVELVAPADSLGGPRGWETILLVEDEDVVRHLERDVLRGSGYTVLEASGPIEAIETSGAYDGVIHLLFTDLVMPDMNGKELASRLTVARPDMRVIFTSGYGADVFINRGMLDATSAFLPKPLTPTSIARSVRDVLDATALRRAS